KTVAIMAQGIANAPLSLPCSRPYRYDGLWNHLLGHPSQDTVENGRLCTGREYTAGPRLRPGAKWGNRVQNTRLMARGWLRRPGRRRRGDRCRHAAAIRSRRWLLRDLGDDRGRRRLSRWGGNLLFDTRWRRSPGVLDHERRRRSSSCRLR